MPETFAASTIASKNLLHSTAAWIWLLELDLNGVSGFRVCAHDTNVTVGGLVYVAFPMTMTADRRDGSGQIPQLDLTISNVGRELITYLEAGQVLDRTLRIKAVHANDLATVIDYGRLSVLRVTCSSTSAMLTVGSYVLSDAEIPSRYWLRGRCAYVYGGAECAFNIPQYGAGGSFAALVAAFKALPANAGFDETKCDLSLEGEDGCRKHGDLELYCGAFKNHPLRFGGNPGIPRGSARV